MEDEHDRLLRQAAFDRVRELSHRHDDLVPLRFLKEGFWFAGRRISYGSFFSGIHRPKELHGGAALSLVTTSSATGRPAYFRGIAPSQYTALAPVFVTGIDLIARTAALEVGLPIADTTPAGLVSDEITRRYATREAAYRLHQHRFRHAVLQAYRTRCTICSLKEDGPMLKNGLQHFHGARILRPPRPADRPDPVRLELRFDAFRDAA